MSDWTVTVSGAMWNVLMLELSHQEPGTQRRHATGCVSTSISALISKSCQLWRGYGAKLHNNSQMQLSPKLFSKIPNGGRKGRVLRLSLVPGAVVHRVAGRLSRRLDLRAARPLLSLHQGAAGSFRDFTTRYLN